MSTLLTIADIAERWQCPVSTAKSTVTDNEIPWVRLTPVRGSFRGGDRKPPWRLRRFRIEDVEVYEKERRQAAPVEREPEPASRAGSFLGNWRN